MKYFLNKGIRMNTSDEVINGRNLFENLNFLNSKEFLEASEQLSDIKFDKTAAVTTLMRTNSPFSACLKDVYQTQTGDIVSGWTNGSIAASIALSILTTVFKNAIGLDFISNLNAKSGLIPNMVNLMQKGKNANSAALLQS